MKIIEIEQNTPQWLEFRKPRIGASEAPIIMGISPFTTRYRLWQEKLELVSRPKMNSRQERGHDLEPKARKCFEKMFGVKTVPRVVVSAKYDWMMASLDGLSLTNDLFIEIKCPGTIDHEIAISGRIPEKYYPQMQHQLACTGLEFGYYFSYDGTQGVGVKVYRNDDYITKLIDQELKFLEMINTFFPPELVDKDYTKIETPEWNETAIKYMDISEQYESLGIYKENLKNKLIELSGRSSVIGAGIRLSKVIKKGHVDYSMIPELLTVNLEQYRKPPIETWRVHRAA